MKNNDNSLFFTCSLVELIGRTAKQKRKDVVNLMGEEILGHIYHHADTLHCEPIDKNANYYIDFCHIPTGNFDNVASCKYTIPSYWDIGKVYARLIEDIQKDDAISALFQVYNSPISDAISYYNSDFFYQSRGFIKETFISDLSAGQAGGNFAEENGKKPAIRFAGFTDAWEQRKLGDVCSISSGIMGDSLLTKGEYLLTRIETIADGIIDETRIGFTNVRPDDSYLLKTGDILYSNINSITHMGKVAIYQGKTTLYHGINLLRLCPRKGIYPDFILFLLNTEAKRDWAKTHANQAVSQASINQTLLESQEILICQFSEQQKIGTFFRSLDSLITLHQRKYDKLMKVKKSMLEKLFPKNGSNVPEMRFSGFTDAWEQRKLGEVATFAKGTGYSKNDLTEQGTPIILYGRLYTKYQTIIDNVDTFVEPRKSSIFSTGNEVIVPASGETAEDISRASAVLKSGILLGGDLNIIYPNDRMNSVFLALSISTGERQKNLSQKAQGKSVVHLHNTDLEVIEISYPSRAEQEQIGTFFRALDDLITLHQRELDKLQKVKKSCLEKMFV